MKKIFLVSLITIVTVIIIIIVIVAFATTGGRSPGSPSESSGIISLDISDASTYRISTTQDNSIKAIRGNLSDNNSNTIQKAPVNKRKLFLVVVPINLTESEIKGTINKLILDVTKQDRDLDEIGILVYDNDRDVNGAYTVAKATWAYGGKWGSTTPDIASSNKRVGYSVTYDIKARASLNQNSPTDQELVIYNDYWDTLNLPGNPRGYQNHPTTLDASNPWETTRMTEVAQRHNLTVEQLLDIAIKVAIWKANN